jgi:hypothetical protein
MDKEQHSILDVPVDAMRGFMEQTSKTDEVLWSEEDLKSIFGHQWSTPLVVDLGGLDDALADRVSMLSSSQGLLLRSFGDLFRHENPPLPLLELSKDFAKRSLYSPFPSIPHAVARVLYFSSIAAALSHCHSKITTLSSEDIKIGIEWALSCDWVTEEARSVLHAGLDVILDEKDIA